MELKIKKVISFSALAGSLLLLHSCATTMNVKSNLSTISVPEEGGISFLKVTEDADRVMNPNVKSGTSILSSSSSAVSITWWTNPVIAVSPDGKRIAYINFKDNMQNIMEKSASQGGSSTQRTFRNWVKDFSWSPDGKKFCFTEYRNNNYGIYMVDANQGSIVRQISSNTTNDFAPVMTKDGKNIYFHRREGVDSYSLWSFDIDKNIFSNYSRGMNPCLVPNKPNVIYCTRFTNNREGEIWRLNLETGVEETVLSQPGRSFSTPQISPDGKWILCTGSSITAAGVKNTDIFAIRTDGTGFTQLTYHPGNDVSAIWAPDGKSIYFLSERGTSDPKRLTYNVWRMDFNL